jgi:hypothetical protein
MIIGSPFRLQSIPRCGRVECCCDRFERIRVKGIFDDEKTLTLVVDSLLPRHQSLVG